MTTKKRPKTGGGKPPDPDHEALGQQALAMRREKRYGESLDLYRQAEKSAALAGERAAEANWISKQGQIYRLTMEPENAERAFLKAREIFLTLDEAGLGGLADQEGNLGLLAADRGDDFAVEYAYRRAIELAEAAGDHGAVGLWARNLGNSLSRRRRYRRAWKAYEKAVGAAKATGSRSDLEDFSAMWAASYADAERWDLAAEQYQAAARAATDIRRRTGHAWKDVRASSLAGLWGRVRHHGTATLMDLHATGASEGSIAEIKRMIAEAKAAPAKSGFARDPGHLKPFEHVAIFAMAHYEKEGNADGMAWVAHLACDILWALAGMEPAAWSDLTSNEGIVYRAVGDAIYALSEANRGEESLELSQRFKGAAFALPAIRAAERSQTNLPEVLAYLEALAALREAVAEFAKAGPKSFQVHARRVRAAGTALLEEGEYLRDRDRNAHARLGGLVPPRHLIDAMPSADTVGIVDFITTTKGMVAHIVARAGAEVRVNTVISPDLSTESVLGLARLWGPEMVHDTNPERSRKVLAHLSKSLHDRFFCRLAHQLVQMGIGQSILVPDPLTRHLPLHLAAVCAQDIIIPGVSMADAEHFCEVLPVEYASCVQAVALSQHQRRPRNIARVASFSDARSDLPGARENGRWLGARLGKGIEYVEHVGKEVTRAALEAEIQGCGMVMIATHGRFDAERPATSCLQLSDHDWTAQDIASLPRLLKSPGVVLAACEISAANPGNDPDADGMPGALLSSGAAFVLGSRWPVEDVSMGYLIERFFHHLSHIGLRPSAVLHRAIKDVRRLGRDDAVKRCRALMEQMGKDGSRESFPDAYFRLDWLALQLEDGGKEHPFEEPRYWGGVVVNGSGWNGLAGGASLGMPKVLELLQGIEHARNLLSDGEAAQAKLHLSGLIDGSDGLYRVQVLELLAVAVAGSAHPVCLSTALDEANAILDDAEFAAHGEQREQILRNLAATRAKLGLLKGT